MGFNGEFAAKIVIDIETVASPDAESFLDPIKAPANYRDEAKIAAFKAEKLHDVIARAALEADLCEVVSVGWWIEGQDAPSVYTRADLNETDLLFSAWAAIELADEDAGVRSIIGFNSLGFDLPVLMRRSQLLGVKFPFINLDRYRTPHIDLMERLTFQGKLTTRSLAFYCRRFGIPCDDTTKGADIAALVAAEDWAGVKAHNLADVRKTTALAQRLGYLQTWDVAPTDASLRASFAAVSRVAGAR